MYFKIIHIHIYLIFFRPILLIFKPGMQHNPEKSSKKRTSLTLLDFYRYRLAIREFYDPIKNKICNWSIIHHAAKLFQQYIVDAWCKVESNNLNFIRQNQNKLRVEMYSGLMDYIQNQQATSNFLPGRVKILPSTFQVIIKMLIVSNCFCSI